MSSPESRSKSRTPVLPLNDDDWDDDYSKPHPLVIGLLEQKSDEEDGFHDYEILSEHYMTIGAFQTQVDDGLSFEEGVDVSIITKNPSGWWYVEMNNEEGWVPSSYLEHINRPHDSNSVSQKSKHSLKPVSPVQKLVSPVPKPVSPVTQSISPVHKPVSPNPVSPDPKPQTQVGHTISPPVSVKPKPKVSQKPSVGPRKSNEGGSSVAAMAAALSKELNNSQEKKEGVSTSRRPSAPSGTKPIVPHRVPTKSDETLLSVKRDSLKRSSSSEAVRTLERVEDHRRSKSPPPLRPRPTNVPPVKKTLSQDSPRQPMKFLRKSTENLLAAQKEEDKLSFSPNPAPRKSISGALETSAPKVPQKTSTVSLNETRSKPPPPQRNHGQPFQTNTLKLAEIEHALKGRKSPHISSKRTVNVGSGVKNIALGPGRPNAQPKRPGPPKSTSQTKKVPPPRPINSPAQTRKITYVTIADYGGDGEGSLSFSEGETVEVLEKNPEGWWYVQIGGKEGWVPSTFIEKSSTKPERPKPPQPSRKSIATRSKPPPPVRKDNQFRAIADYITPIYEDSGINLLAGELYEVLEKNEGGWWFVKRGQEEGWAPSSFLEQA